MDTNAIGQFIAKRRKQKGYTQKELAEKLQVTDKAVSRWETGRGLPDTSLLKSLSDILDVSVSDLLSGEIIEDADIKNQTDKILLDTLKYSGQMFARLINFSLFLTGGAFLLSPLFLAGGRHYWVIGIFLICIAFLRIYLQRKNKTVKLTDRGFYILGIASLMSALIMELLPIGAVLVFAPSPTETMVERYSYFSLNLVGYAQFTPMLTGILTIAGLLLSAVSIIKFTTAAKLKNAAFICSVMAALLSLAPLFLFGFTYMVSASYAISATIIASLCFQAISNRNG